MDANIQLLYFETTNLISALPRVDQLRKLGGGGVPLSQSRELKEREM
jgi:hypothetical protein